MIRDVTHIPTPDEIRELRIGLGLKQKDMERLMGVTHPMQSKWETGVSKPNKTMARLMAIFKEHPELVREMADGNPVILEENAMYRSGGYVYTNLAHDDAMLGRAVRGVFKAIADLGANDQEALLLSVQHYLSYGTIEMPVYEIDNPTMDDLPRTPVALFKQFLITAGEDTAAVDTVMREQWDEMVKSIEDNQ